MAIHRGIQSAIFYYLSCAPCAEARVRRQRKEEAKRDRIAREALEAEMGPDLYRHPSPSSTNPHWQAEIALGPTLAARGKRRTNTQLGTSRGQSSVDLPPKSAGGSLRHDSKVNLKTSPYQREDEELWGSSVHLDGGNSNGGGAYLTATHSTNHSMRANSVRRSSSPRRPPTAHTRDPPTTSSSNAAFRNPAINDLHPATVTRVTHADEVRWMLQPVPVAEVMSGKISPHATPRAGAVTDRAVDAALRVGNPPALGLSGSRAGSYSRGNDGMGGSRSNSRQGSSSGQRHDRSHLLQHSTNPSTSERDFALFPHAASTTSPTKTSIHQRSPRLPPLDVHHPHSAASSRQNTPRLGPVISRTLSNTSSAAGDRTPLASPLHPHHHHHHHHHQQQQLSPTWQPSSYDAEDSSTFVTPVETPSELPATPANAFFPTTSAGGLSHGKIYTATAPVLLASSPASSKSTSHLGAPITLTRSRSSHTATAAANRGLRREDSLLVADPDDLDDDDSPAESKSSRGPAAAATHGPASGELDLLATWQAPGFELPKYIYEHTRREGVRERWSMDL